ncbi:MAG: hypothetical protein GXZ04_01605 [Clostridiales bacterium]|nr:hypothetical protein [Clostridiales bacterium]
MSENRSRYSSVPLQDLKRKPAKPQPAKAPSHTLGPSAQPGSFILLQVMLVAVLPLGFFVSLLLKDTRIYWAFVITGLVCIGLMYLLKAFVPNARRVLGVIHTAMIAVVLFAILVSGPLQSDARNQAQPNPQSIFSDDTSASIIDMNENLAGVQDQTTPNPGAASQAQLKLDQFMAAWATKDYPEMVKLSAPNWKNQFETEQDAETDIFHRSYIRTPINYQVIDVSGNDTDQTRTITMNATMGRNDGQAAQLYQFQILMIRNNNEWFVDPNSISSPQLVQQTAQQSQADMGAQAMAEEGDQANNQVQITTQVAVPQVNATRSDTVLYYNADGGEYYHLDPNCTSIGAKYKPLKASFYYRDVSNETFKNLKTCPHCNAPKR